MAEREIMASVFKQQCLALLDQVARTKTPIIITKHGKAVARLVPLEEGQPRKPIFGSVTLLAEREEDYFSTGEPWKVDLEPEE